MLNFIRKIDEFIWHCPHPCACVGGPDQAHPKAYRYASTLALPQGSQLIRIAAISLTISKTGGSIMLHRSWGAARPEDLQPCDLVGQCLVARAIASGGGDVTVPLRAIGPWHDKSKTATFANLKASGDPAMSFLIAHAQQGSRAQPESFWHALQAQLVQLAAPILAQGGQGP